MRIKIDEGTFKLICQVTALNLESNLSEFKQEQLTKLKEQIADNVCSLMFKQNA